MPPPRVYGLAYSRPVDTLLVHHYLFDKSKSHPLALNFNCYVLRLSFLKQNLIYGPACQNLVYPRMQKTFETPLNV